MSLARRGGSSDAETLLSPEREGAPVNATRSKVAAPRQKHSGTEEEEKKKRSEDPREDSQWDGSDQTHVLLGEGVRVMNG